MPLTEQILALFFHRPNNEGFWQKKQHINPLQPYPTKLYRWTTEMQSQDNIEILAALPTHSQDNTIKVASQPGYKS